MGKDTLKAPNCPYSKSSKFKSGGCPCFNKLLTAASASSVLDKKDEEVMARVLKDVTCM